MSSRHNRDKVFRNIYTVSEACRIYVGKLLSGRIGVKPCYVKANTLITAVFQIMVYSAGYNIPRRKVLQGMIFHYSFSGAVDKNPAISPYSLGNKKRIRIRVHEIVETQFIESLTDFGGFVLSHETV
ncbi:unnamed protein product, partial [marine sediment metagenome]